MSGGAGVRKLMSVHAAVIRQLTYIPSLQSRDGAMGVGGCCARKRKP